MPREYVKIKQLAEEMFRRKEMRETNREIGEHFGLSRSQIKQLVAWKNRKKRKIVEEEYTPR